MNNIIIILYRYKYVSINLNRGNLTYIYNT